MKEIKISITGQGMDNKASSPVSKEMEGDIAEMESMDEEKFAAMAPKGAFTARGLNALVKATNKLLPVFGQTGDYPTFSQDIKVLPTDFVRVLAMFVTAIDDAIKDEIVGPEMAIDMESIKDDTSLTTIAGKLEMLSKLREFKKWLSEAPKSETNLSEASEYNMTGEEEAPVDAESLMMSRM